MKVTFLEILEATESCGSRSCQTYSAFLRFCVQKLPTWNINYRQPEIGYKSYVSTWGEVRGPGLDQTSRHLALRQALAGASVCRLSINVDTVCPGPSLKLSLIDPRTLDRNLGAISITINIYHRACRHSPGTTSGSCITLRVRHIG